MKLRRLIMTLLALTGLGSALAAPTVDAAAELRITRDLALPVEIVQTNSTSQDKTRIESKKNQMHSFFPKRKNLVEHDW